MAYEPEVFVASKTTMTVNDYAAATVTISPVEVDSLVAPIVQTRGDEEILTNSSTGTDIYAEPDTGLAGGQTHSFNVLYLDPKNDTNVTSLLSLFRGLYKNSVAGTGFSGYTFTNQLTGKGRLQFKCVYTERNELGTSHVTTVPSICVGLEKTVVGKHFGYTVTCRVVGAITVA